MFGSAAKRPFQRLSLITTNRGGAGRIFARIEGPADRHRNAKQAEIGRTDSLGPKLLGQLTARPVHHATGEGGDVLQRLRLLRPKREFRGGPAAERSLRCPGLQDYDSVRMRERWFLKQDSVDEGKNGRIRADAEREGYHRSECERTALQKQAQGVTEILDQCLHA